MQPMPQLICLYVCAYVYLDPSATSPARGVMAVAQSQIIVTQFGVRVTFPLAKTRAICQTPTTTTIARL